MKKFMNSVDEILNESFGVSPPPMPISCAFTANPPS